MCLTWHIVIIRICHVKLTFNAAVKREKTTEPSALVASSQKKVFRVQNSIEQLK